MVPIFLLSLVNDWKRFSVFLIVLQALFAFVSNFQEATVSKVYRSLFVNLTKINGFLSLESKYTFMVRCNVFYKRRTNRFAGLCSDFSLLELISFISVAIPDTTKLHLLNCSTRFF